MASSTSQKPIRVAIVGGGIGGLCLAVHLVKQPHLDVQVYEAAHAFAEIGAGVSIGPNAQQAMRILGGDVEKAFLGIATYNQWEEYKNVWVEVNYGQGPNKGQTVTSLTNSTGQCSAHRAQFLDEFIKFIPKEKSHFGKRLVEVEEVGAEGVRMHFKDGTTATADCVIGAEGIHSTTRKYILGADDPNVLPKYSGFVAFRAIVPMEEALKVLDERSAVNAMVEIGSDAGILHYPIDHGKILNIIALQAQSTWEEEKWIMPADHATLLKRYDDWTPKSQTLIQLMNRPGLSRWALWDLMSASTFHKGRVIMMGDAAHAPTPFHGQGAGQAIEDSLILGKLFENVTDLEQIQPAFEAYNRVRRIRGLKNVETSRSDAALWTVADPAMLTQPEELKRKFDATMSWLWEHDLQSDVDEAKTIFAKLIAHEAITE